MNPQQAGFQYPPPGTQAYNYQFEFPPPQQQGVPQQQPTSQFGAYRPGAPQQLPQQQYPPQQQHQTRYFPGYQQQATPQGQSPRRRPPARKQQNAQQRTADSSPSSPPRNDPGAPPPQPTSPEMDTFDQNLMSALRSNNNNNNQAQQANASQQSPNNEQDELTEPIFHLPPPPETSFPSEAELEKAMHAWSLEHGYELVRRASKKNARGQIYKRYYHCSKHGMKAHVRVPSPSRRRQKKRTTNRIGCPMSLASVAVDPSNPEEGMWQIRHRKTHHNHPALEAVSLAGHRRRAREGNVEKAVDSLFAIGTSTSQVLVFLQKTNPRGLFTRTDVANMKQKWRKWGTCGVRPEGGGEPGEVEGGHGRGGGYGTACARCREKKVACGHEKPVCGQCQRGGAECRYDREVQSRARAADEDDEDEVQDGIAASFNAPPPQQSSEPQQANEEVSFLRGSRSGRPTNAQAAATKDILASLLPSFSAETFTRERLSLQSSSVEVLAQSSCGTGESFKSITPLSHPSRWPQWRDAMAEASRKENCYDVLAGRKFEPVRPAGQESAQVEVEVWNEYIKQLAIYNRRNDMLLYGLRANLSPYYYARVQNYTHAAHIWSALEDVMAPQGSQTAFALFNELHNITLAESTDLKDYIHKLASTYERFKQLKLNTSPPPLHRTQASLPTAQTGGDAVTEEAVCFLFLRNLGPEWQRWVESIVATNNVGGFGTGERVGLKELGKRAEAWGRMQQNGGGV